MPKLRSVPEIVAASKCQIARQGMGGFGMQSLHRKGSDGFVIRCAFCDVPLPELVVMLEDAHRWNNHNEGAPFKDFGRLPPGEQTRRVNAAMYPGADLGVAPFGPPTV